MLWLALLVTRSRNSSSISSANKPPQGARSQGNVGDLTNWERDPLSALRVALKTGAELSPKREYLVLWEITNFMPGLATLVVNIFCVLSFM
jgi:hypothetical protein